jgi:UDP-N-acetylmuramyl pentapeptide phosphotransferase/UDP-N-acetylglucosamine-1-phosphate transferase
MEPLDTELDSSRGEPRQASPGSRYNLLLLLPIFGLLLALTFIGAAIFQWNLSDLVDGLIGLFLLLFVVTIALLFWAGTPRSSQT